MSDKEKKSNCRWRLSKRFQYECTYCHSLDQDTCKDLDKQQQDEDEEETKSFNPFYYMGGGL